MHVSISKSKLAAASLHGLWVFIVYVYAVNELIAVIYCRRPLPAVLHFFFDRQSFQNKILVVEFSEAKIQNFICWTRTIPAGT